MPNWCECDLWISAIPKNKEERKSFPGILNRFVDSAAGKYGCLDMNNFIPYPNEYAVLDKKAREAHEKWEALSKEEREKIGYPDIKDGYNQGGYEWCIVNWGVKWNFNDPKLIKKEKLKAVYTFMTPWSPPNKIIFKMSEMFPQLEFKLKYYEIGMEFQGTLILKGGNVIKNESKKYKGGRGG